MQQYLQSCEHINHQHPTVQQKAAELAQGLSSDVQVAQACFLFVRDHIKHSWDYQLNPVTCQASDVLQHGTGYCYAKSHLLAALLRANKIPAGLCYQRLTISNDQPPFCLHGLNAVYLQDFGWYKMDARGNKPGVDAQFCPPREQLAFKLLIPGEKDLAGIHATPLTEVTQVLTQYQDVIEVANHLPDVEFLEA